MTDQDIYDRWLDAPAERADRECAAWQAKLDAIASRALEDLIAGETSPLGHDGDQDEIDLALALREAMAGLSVLGPSDAVTAVRRRVGAHLESMAHRYAERVAE
jgi:hypothetical protein